MKTVFYLLSCLSRENILVFLFFLSTKTGQGQGSVQVFHEASTILQLLGCKHALTIKALWQTSYATHPPLLC